MHVPEEEAGDENTVPGSLGARYARCGGITAVMNHLPGHLHTATGLLYRDPDDLPDLAADGRAFNAAGYLARPEHDRVSERRGHRVFAGNGGGLGARAARRMP
jgi:hypothetical protein